MRQIMKALTFIAPAAFFVACTHGQALQSQAPDAVESNAGNNLGASAPSEVCQKDEACLAALNRCRAGLNRDSAKDQLEALEECRNSFQPQVTPVALPASACTGPYMDTTSCTCRMGVDGTGDLNHVLVPIRPYSSPSLFVCLTRADLLTHVESQARRITTLEGRVPYWDSAKRKVDELLIAISNGDDKDVTAKWDEIMAWNLGAKQALSRWYKDVESLFHENQQTNEHLQRICPTIPGRPEARLMERCDEMARQSRTDDLLLRSTR